VLRFTILAMVVLVSAELTNSRGQDTDEVRRLKERIELLEAKLKLAEKENELLKKEMEILKKEAKIKPDTGSDPKPDAKARTKASSKYYRSCDYELVSCVRDPKNADRIIFTFSVVSETDDITIGGGPSDFRAFYLTLTGKDGKALGGKVKLGPPGLVKLTKGIPSKFQLTYGDINKEIVELEKVQLGESNFGREVMFYNIKIESK